jgi:hypothetical protein
MMCAAAAAPSGRSSIYAAAHTPAFVYFLSNRDDSTQTRSRPIVGSYFASSARKFYSRTVWYDSAFEPFGEHTLNGRATTLGVIEC